MSNGDETIIEEATAAPTEAVEPNSDQVAPDESTIGGESTVESKDTDSSNDDVPDTYADFTLPEGMALDSELLAEAAPVFKDLGLTQTQAQTLIDLQSKKAEADVQKQMNDFNQMIDGWKQQSQDDKEFGGDKFDESVAVAREAIDKFGTPELKDLLSEHGVGNHPEVIRFMVKVGNLTREKSISGGGRPASPNADRIEQLYSKT